MISIARGDKESILKYSFVPKISLPHDEVTGWGGRVVDN